MIIKRKVNTINIFVFFTFAKTDAYLWRLYNNLIVLQFIMLE